jgi:hypothetical protein
MALPVNRTWDFLQQAEEAARTQQGDGLTRPFDPTAGAYIEHSNTHDEIGINKRRTPKRYI